MNLCSILVGHRAIFHGMQICTVRIFSGRLNSFILDGAFGIELTVDGQSRERVERRFSFY